MSDIMKRVYEIEKRLAEDIRRAGLNVYFEGKPTQQGDIENYAVISLLEILTQGVEKSRMFMQTKYQITLYFATEKKDDVIKNTDVIIHNIFESWDDKIDYVTSKSLDSIIPYYGGFSGYTVFQINLTINYFSKRRL